LPSEKEEEVKNREEFFVKGADLNNKGGNTK